MQAIVPIDVEDALRVAIQAHTDASVYVRPLPQRLPERSVCVSRVGGTRVNKVLDSNLVSIDCRAGDVADATELADEICGIVAALEDEGTFPAVSVNALPYLSSDPSHPDVSRVSMTLQVFSRAEIKEL